MVTWLHCFWACGKAEPHGREHEVEQSCSLNGDPEAERERKELETKYTLKSTRPVNYFLH